MDWRGRRSFGRPLSGLGLALLVVTGSASVAGADIFGGGGSKKSDCLLVLDTPINDPFDKPKRVRCTDGDPICDADATVNGTCVFPTAVCANSSFDVANCTLVGLESATIEHAEDNGDPDFDTEYQALQSRIDNELNLPNSNPDACTGFTNVSVDVRGPFPKKKCKKGRKKMKIFAESVAVMGKRTKDVDKLKMFCDPAPLMCDAQAFFSGTLDRLQNQIFDKSCAIGGCHESQSVAGGLLLEAGTSHGALVDVVPTNPAAQGAGLKRITTTGPDSGDPAASYLFLKIEDELGPGMGERMPFGGKKLSSGFRDIFELWIAAGAPETGWVPGTDE
jgi:hypothetical protein